MDHLVSVPFDDKEAMPPPTEFVLSDETKDSFFEDPGTPELEEDISGLDPMDEENSYLLCLPTAEESSEKPRPAQDLTFTIPLDTDTLRKSCLKALWSILLFLLPSFVSNRIRKQDKPVVEARYTAYLDGLRGFAAYCVFNTHLAAKMGRPTGMSYGYSDTYEFYTLPVIRLIYNGDFAVNLFFVISGFALSIAPITEMRRPSKDPGRAMTRLAGSIFRRPIRLYGPPFVSTFIVLILVRCGYFEAYFAHMEEFSQLVTGYDMHTVWALKSPSLMGQLWDMVKYDLEMFEVFSIALRNQFTYNGVVWTIPFEFRASLMLMLAHAPLFFMRQRGRVATVGLLLTLALLCRSWDLPLFWSGYLIAEFAHFSRPEPVLGEPWTSRKRLLPACLWWAVLAAGLYLGSYPQWVPEQTPGYAWLAPYTIPGSIRFWTSTGAALTVLGISHLPPVIRVLVSPLFHYMGQISFALYLVHFWIVHVIGTYLFYDAWSLTGVDEDAEVAYGALLAYPVLLLITIWVADIFWRAVDKPLVNLAARIHKAMFFST